MKKLHLITAATAMFAALPILAVSQVETSLTQEMHRAELEGVSVRLKDISRFRGVRYNQLTGFGIVVGLSGSGDSQQTPFTATLLANALETWGHVVSAQGFRPRNIAVVSISAELPPFAAPGNRLDITVSSVGDAKSLQGGFLIPAPLMSVSDPQTVYALASGSVSIGGFSARSGGASASQNHPTVGRIPGGGTVERGVQTQVVFSGSTLFVELNQQDITTAQRVQQRINESYPEFLAAAMDGGTIRIQLPPDASPMMAMSQLEALTVFADVPAVVVVNERTGTIVIGGNVKLGPAVIAHGSLQVRIDPDYLISQPAPFGSGETVVAPIPRVEASEAQTQIGIIRPNATINDLARILQRLNVSARDIIAILQALQQQGALKAEIKIQ